MAQKESRLSGIFPALGHGAALRPQWAGVACTLAWAFWLNGASGEPTDQPPWQLSYIVLSLMMAGIGLLGLKRPNLAEGRLGAAGAAIGALGTLLLFVSLHVPGESAAQIPAYLLCGCALGLSYLQWGPFYAKVSTRQAVVILFTANIAASALKCLVHFVPDPASTAIAMLLPVASALTCSRAKASAPSAPEPAVHFSRESVAGLWKMLTALAVFSFLAAFLLGHSVGNQSAVPPLDFAMARAFEAAVSVVVMAYVVLGKSFNFAQLWRIVLMALAADVLLQTVLPQFQTLRSLESAAWDLIVLFSWLTIADVARHADVDASAAFGLGWPFYTLPFALGSLAATNLGAAELGNTMVAVVLFALLATSAFCLEVRDQDTKWIFAELDEGAKGSRNAAEADGMDARCARLAEERGLSPRELEVMKYLCKGRTKAYIAETLYLSENTVRSHAKHIYTKLDVHSKRELMDLVGVE